jgi:hypothetical protein
MDLATVDKLLTTARTVRKRLNCTRPVDPEIIQTCLEIALQHRLGGTSRAITSWWSPMQHNVPILLLSTNGHTSRCIPRSDREYRKIKRPFPPTVSAHPMPLCSRWCPRLASARTPRAAHPGEHPTRACPRRPAPQGTDRAGGWGRAAGAAGVAWRALCWLLGAAQRAARSAYPDPVPAGCVRWLGPPGPCAGAARSASWPRSPRSLTRILRHLKLTSGPPPLAPTRPGS